ncbi:putative photosynthetic complex assembly protein PuhE [Sphingomonas humi]|uniref:Photosynthetic complex assembly protein PuhE n=1 Tax=Sphingomonas humi TaxID=335630 RepID=A0ABP7RUU0_9SPHN
MSLTGHLLPAAAVLIAWFASTGLVVWLVYRPRATYRPAMVWTTLAAIAGVAVVAATRHDPGAPAAYAAALAALAIWAWQEFAFLTGAAAGPRRIGADPGIAGVRRFLQASATLLWHELALAALLVMLVGLSWGMPNQTGAAVFGLLFALRLAAKLAIFSGVPNLTDELLPAHLHHLRSYYGPRRMSLTLVAMLGASIVLSVLLASRALASPQAAAPSLLFALAALGTLELLFLALPVRDGALWRWARPAPSTLRAGRSALGASHGL